MSTTTTTTPVEPECVVDIFGWKVPQWIFYIAVTVVVLCLGMWVKNWLFQPRYYGQYGGADLKELYGKSFDNAASLSPNMHEFLNL